MAGELVSGRGSQPYRRRGGLGKQRTGDGKLASMSDQPLPLAGLRVIDCTVERGELAARLLGDLGAEVVKVEAPGGSPARALAPVRRGVSLAWAVRNAGKLGMMLDLGDGGPVGERDRDRFSGLLDHSDVLVASGAQIAGGLDMKALAAAHPHLVVVAVTAFGLDGPFSDYVATDAVLSATGGIAFKAGVAEGTPLFPPGHLVDDLVSVTAAFAALCALYQRESTGAGQFVELSANEAIALAADWALPNVSARVLAGEPPAEVRNGSGPVYPVFKCKDGYVRLVVLSPRQWRALREWLGEPEYLQDPELESFVSRLMIAATVINPLLVEHFAKFGMDEAAAEAQRRGIVCTPALPPARVLENEHLRSRGTFAPMRMGDDVTAPMFTGFYEVDGVRAGPQDSPPEVGQHTEQVFANLGDSRPAPASIPAPSPPLTGVRVMDFGIGAVGVEVGRRLAEYGAEVIKIESRAYPDFMRTVTGGEFSPSFVSSSRSKLGFGANAQTPEGHEILLRLTEHSDVVVENNSTGTMDDLGLGFEDLTAVNPNVVMVSSQLMGSRGTWADWRGYGPTGQGPGGLLHLWNYADRDDPAGSASIYPDHYAGCLGAVGALAALVGRERGTCATTTHVEVAQVEAVAGSLADLLAAAAVEPGSVVPTGNRSEQGAPWGLYPCAGEEQWVAITCRDDADWRALRAAMGEPDWATDPALDHATARHANTAMLDEKVAEWTRTDTKDAIATRCQQRGVPAAPMLTGTDMGSHPHYVARQFAIRIDQQVLGEMVLDGAAFHGDLMVGPDVRGAPAIGEHTREISASVLGLDDAEVDKLLAMGALETTPPVAHPTLSESPG
jgi:crotonobetainyl-CoA:carnitine CoA-transferase CaiB-like acyl-CoA transferase